MQMVSGTPWETVSLTALSRDRTLFPSLLAEARDAALRGQEGRLVVHTAWGTEWRPFGLPRRKRPLRSVVLAPGVGEKIVEDVSAFLGRREWYADRGVCSRLQKKIKLLCFNWVFVGKKASRIAGDICFTVRRDRESRRSYRLSLARCRTTYAY
jgi:BCS1 N terminal